MRSEVSSAATMSGQTMTSAVVGERAGGDLAARRLLEQDLERLVDEVGQLGVGRDEVGRRARVVLGLRHEVDRDERGHRGLVGEHEDLGGAGEHVDAHVAHDELLGGGHVRVAGADDLVDARDGLGAVRERGDRLRAADLVDLVDAGLGGGGERVRVHGAVGRGRHDHRDLVDAGHHAPESRS